MEPLGGLETLALLCRLIAAELHYQHTPKALCRETALGFADYRFDVTCHFCWMRRDVVHVIDGCNYCRRVFAGELLPLKEPQV